MNKIDTKEALKEEKTEKVICPYCQQEFKKISNMHLNTHSINRMEFLKEHEPKKYYEERLSEFIMDFISHQSSSLLSK